MKCLAKSGVVILGHFAPDRAFGTYHKVDVSGETNAGACGFSTGTVLIVKLLWVDATGVVNCNCTL